MSVREYIGARYVPVFADPVEWDISKTYEPLTMVTYQGNTYTSRQAVPANIPITDNIYWVLTGNYNAQVEQYRQDVQNEVTARQNADNAINTLIANMSEGFNVKDYGAVGDGHTNDTDAFKAAIQAAVQSIPTGEVVFNDSLNDKFIANVIIPSGTYLINEDIELPAISNLITSNDNRVCGINIIGYQDSIIRFDGYHGFNIKGAYVKIINISVENALTAFNFETEEDRHIPYVCMENIFIKKCANGIKFNKGTYMSVFKHIICFLYTGIAFDFGEDSTSLNISNCYANSGGNIGFKLKNSRYTTISNCACDGGAIAYDFTCDSNEDLCVTMLSCGAEIPTSSVFNFNMPYKGNINIINFFVAAGDITPAFVHTVANDGKIIFDNVQIKSHTGHNIKLISDTSSFNSAIEFINMPTQNDRVIIPENKRLKINQSKTIYIDTANANVSIAQIITNNQTYSFMGHIDIYAGTNRISQYHADLIVLKSDTPIVTTFNVVSNDNTLISDVSFTLDNNVLYINSPYNDMRGQFYINNYGSQLIM